jgi:HSP20 family molecular chaperone IbpA
MAFNDFGFGGSYINKFNLGDFKDIGNLIKTCADVYTEEINKEMNKNSQPQKDNHIKYDIIESIDKYQIIFDAPGISKDKITLNIVDNNLYIQIDRTYILPTDFTYKIHNRFNSIYSSEINIPSDTDHKSINAKYDNGLLIVSFNKKVKSNGIKVMIS